MESKEIKMNLGLVDALIKLREASVIFDQQAAIISEKKTNWITSTRKTILMPTCSGVCTQYK